ncbi:MAG: ribokinase [Clostridia bacterium]|nr:ribokinase [Clostridia bacterium]
MPQKPRILVVSSANIDLVARMRSVPRVGETVLEANRYDYIPGGKGANSALAIAKTGGESVFCCKLGNDTHGAKLVSIYEGSGINTRFVTADKKERTGLALVMVEQNADNRIVVYPGANRRLRPSDVEDAFTCYPDALYLQFEIPEETVIAAADMAHAQGIPIIVDAGPANRDFPLEALGPVEIFSPNEEETYAYTGIRPSSLESCLKACLALAARIQAKYYVLKLGERGVYLYDGKYYNILSSYNVEEVDTTAAGDAFTGAMAVEYMRSYDIKRACEYGNIAGAITVSRAGAFPSIPSHEEIKFFAKESQSGFTV